MSDSNSKRDVVDTLFKIKHWVEETRNDPEKSKPLNISYGTGTIFFNFSFVGRDLDENMEGKLVGWIQALGFAGGMSFEKTKAILESLKLYRNPHNDKRIQDSWM